MSGEELNDILMLHKKWLNKESGGKMANLSKADLSGANLSKADLREADLREADLDYCCLPLWCGSLTAKMDDRQVKQLLYHTLSIVKGSPFVSTELKDKLLTEQNVAIANQFHRVNECGEL